MNNVFIQNDNEIKMDKAKRVDLIINERKTAFLGWYVHANKQERLYLITKAGIIDAQIPETVFGEEAIFKVVKYVDVEMNAS